MPQSNRNPSPAPVSASTMAYQVLARKWRPQDFSSVIGQEPIVTALRNALTEGRVAQAYLFSGIRGVGKTTVARVLAKALNCERGPAADPCNECIACLEISQGSDLDVLEVDAATYSKVEQVRELTESLRYGPARNRHKVVVLDEVHRLSRQAFDALLKILEEPPPHLVFIFATTEIEAVPATILSRCQEFHFHRVPGEKLSRHLREIAAAEGIEASEPALRLISRAAEGSVRDAVALLDQLATFGGGRVPEEEALRLMGGAGPAFYQRVLAAVLAGDAGAVAGAVAEAEAAGWDPRHLYNQFLAYCRDGLHLAMGGEEGALDLPAEEAAALAALAAGAGYENLLRILHQLLASETAVRRSEAGPLALEIAWLRAAELPKLTRIEEILGGGPPRTEEKPGGAPAASRERAVRSARAERAGQVPRPAPAAPASGPDPAAPAPAAKAGEATARGSARPAEPPASTGEPAAGEPAAEDEEGRLRAFREQVACRRELLAAHLDAAEGLVFTEGQLKIYAPPGDSWLAVALERPANRSAVDEAIAAVWGPGVTWSVAEGKGAARRSGGNGGAVGNVRSGDPGGHAAPADSSDPGDPNDPSGPNGPSDRPDLIHDPTVQTVLELFGGTVASVERREPTSED